MSNGAWEVILDGSISIGTVICVILTCKNVGTEGGWISYFSNSNNDLYQIVTYTKYLQDIAQYLAILGYFFNLLVLIGVFAAVVGYKKTSTKCACILLLTFAATSLLALFSNTAAIVLAHIAKNQFRLTVPSLMYNSLIRSYVNDAYYNNTTYTREDSSGVYWNELQYELQCCGVYGSKDYQKVTWHSRNPAALAPSSCCVTAESFDGSSTLAQQCLDFGNRSNYYNWQGCYDAVSQYVSNSEGLVISMGTFVIAQVILTIFVRMLYGLFHK